MNTPDQTRGGEGRTPSASAAPSDPYATRDPVTGTPDVPAPHDEKPLHERDPDEIAHDIRRTRAGISETLNRIEARISPHQLKEQVKGTIHETIDEVQERLSPRHFVHNARRTMIDTIRENPIASVIAGLSLGYLIFNPSSERERRVRGYDRVAGYGPYGYDRYGTYGYSRYGPTYETGYESYDGRAYESYGQQAADDEGGMLGSARERTKEMAHQTSERMSHLADQTQERMSHLADRTQEQMYRARSGVEAFVQDNPLAAGAIALGLGALIGGMLPPTQQEQAMMGRASERVTDRLGEAASHTMQQAKEAVRHVADEARQAAQDESGTFRSVAQHVADRVKDTAREEAQQVRDTVRDEARGMKDTSEDGTRPSSQRPTTAW